MFILKTQKLFFCEGIKTIKTIKSITDTTFSWVVGRFRRNGLKGLLRVGQLYRNRVGPRCMHFCQNIRPQNSKEADLKNILHFLSNHRLETQKFYNFVLKCAEKEGPDFFSQWRILVLDGQ
jgi:hypothetical protein